MNEESFSEKIDHYIDKYGFLRSLIRSKNVVVSLDRLNNEKEVDQELIYFKDDNKEHKGIFVFSYDFFLKELKDHDMKRYLGPNFLNLQIHHAYLKLKKQIKNVSVNDIIEEIVKRDECCGFITKNKILKRILTIAYYHNWELKKDDNSVVDSNYFINMPNDFKKLKQRFNIHNSITILDDDKYFFFINGKGDLTFVFKEKSVLNKQDICELLDIFLKEFNIKKYEMI